MKAVDIRVKGFDNLTRTVRDGGSSGRISVPRSWIGKKAQIILLEEPDPDTPET